MATSLDSDTSSLSTSTSSSSSTPTQLGNGEGSRRKRVMIVTMGSRGDTQPYVALGLALHERAHCDVVILTHQPHSDFVEREGRGLVEFHGMMGDPAAFLHSEEGARVIYEAGMSELFKMMVEEGRKSLEPNFREVLRFGREWNPDLLISSITEISIVVAAAEILQLPMVIASTVPVYPSEYHAPIMMRPTPFPFRWMNKAVNWLGSTLFWHVFFKEVRDHLAQLRAEFSLPPQSGFEQYHLPMLCMYSEIVFPRAPDYPEHVQCTGYWILPPPADDYQSSSNISQELREFLDAGEPPVYMGFGSMPVRNAHELLRMFATEIKHLGLRGIFCLGWLKNFDSESVLAEVFGDGARNVICIGGAPHEWLFPRCSLAIHHGGAGTTAASLRAGIPTCIMPVLADQPFWAVRCSELGVGPTDPVPLKDITPEKLRRYLVEAQRADCRQRAREVQQQLLLEDGLEVAIRAIESFMGPKHFVAKAL